MLLQIFSAIALWTSLAIAEPLEKAATAAPVAGVIWPPQYVIPMTAAEPSRAFGTSKIPTITRGEIIQVQFNMNTKAGDRCDLYFTFPQQEAHNKLHVNIATFRLSGHPSFKAQQLQGAIWPSTTTWANRPKRFGNLYDFQMRSHGNVKVATVTCPPSGQTIAFEIWTEGSNYVKFIQMHGNGMRDNGIFVRQYSA